MDTRSWQRDGSSGCCRSSWPNETRWPPSDSRFRSYSFLLLGTGFMITPMALLAVSVVVFVAGMEIRIRLEEKLLASRFGETFSDYQRRVPAYVPFLR